MPVFGLTFAAALLLRLAIAAVFHGSDDIDSQLREGELILERVPVYSRSAGNKLPLGYLLPAAMIAFASVSGLPASFTLKLPAIFGDALAALIIRRLGRRAAGWSSSDAAAAAYLWNPATIMLSAYHGNVDPLMAGLMLTAVDLHFRRASALSGMALGVAVAMKPPALLMLPVLFLYAEPRLRWTLVAAATAFPVAFSIPFVVSDLGFSRVFSYASLYGTWGIPLILKQTYNLVAQFAGAPPAVTGVIAEVNDIVATYGRYLLLVILAVWFGTIARRRRATLDPPEIIRDVASTFFVFYVFASGFGIQYLGWGLPFLLLHSRRLATVYIAAISPYLAGRYVHAVVTQKYPGTPLTEHLRLLSTEDLVLLVVNGVLGVAAWIVCTGILYRLVRRPSTSCG